MWQSLSHPEIWGTKNFSWHIFTVNKFWGSEIKEEDKKWLIGKLGNSPPKQTLMVSLHQHYFILRRDGHYGLSVSWPAMGVHS